jgi:predicted RNA-binding protein with PUA-like domain
MAYWLVKSEPSGYSWDDLLADKETVWSGIRNYAARLHLNNMKKGDRVLFYHSNDGLDIKGIAKVTKTAFQDPTTEDDRWVAVKLKADKPFNRSVTLAEIKKQPELKNMALIRISRLSVQPVTESEWNTIVELASSNE